MGKGRVWRVAWCAQQRTRQNTLFLADLGGCGKPTQALPQRPAHEIARAGAFPPATMTSLRLATRLLPLLLVLGLLAPVLAGWELAGDPHETYMPFQDPGACARGWHQQNTNCAHSQIGYHAVHTRSSRTAR